MALSVSILLGELGPSGGVRAVLEHARRLAGRHGMEVRVVTWEEPPADALPDGVEGLSLEEAAKREVDVALATWWRTAYSLFDLPARRYAYFVQSLEERLYRPGDPERLGAVLTHGLPLSFVTEAAWIAELLGDLRPDVPCRHVPNGIDKELFRIPAEPPRHDGPLRVLVEGSPDLWFKGVPDALAALELMTEPHSTTLVTPERSNPDAERRFDRVLGPLPHAEMPAVYSEHDVLLKLSRVEGVFTPPLEAFHCGATCVVWPVTGHDEYVRHAENGVVVGWDDLPGTAAWLDLLARDRELLGGLKRGALETARSWPSWDDSTERMAEALEGVATDPEPAASLAASRLLADTDAAMEELRRARAEEQRRTEAAKQETREREKRLQHVSEALWELEGSRFFRLRSALRGLLASIRR